MISKLLPTITFIIVVSTEARSQDSPVGRASAHLFYLPSPEAAILIDGYENSDDAPQQAETWQLKNQRWQKISSGEYESRKLTAAAFDNDKNEIFMFGGIGKGGYDFKKKDGLKFDGKKWTRVPANDIGTRDHHEMTYANHLKAFVMYGGVTTTRDYDSATWIFQNNQWKPLNIPGPGKRVHHAMAYDPIRKKVILFGGSTNNDSSTWEFDGATWTNIANANEPGDVRWHSMVYDPTRNAVLMYAGKNLWSWNGAKWSRLSDNAPDRILAAICFDTKRKVLILFGGVDDVLQSDTWQWDGKGWKQILTGQKWQWDDGVKKYVLKSS
jgi:hypothetical protein